MDAFLETTAMVDLIFQDKRRRNQVRELLEAYEAKYSSQYVKMEIKRGVLQYYVALYNKSVECKNIGEVYAYVHTLSATPKRNMLGTILGALEAFYKDVENRAIAEGLPAGEPLAVQKKLLEGFLRTQIRRFWPSFPRQVDVVLDHVECYKHKYALNPPVMTAEGKFDNTLQNCDKYKPGICRIREVLNENEDPVRLLLGSLQKIGAPDQETQKRIRAMKEMMRLQKRDVLQKDCWRSGDVVIALEAPDESEIVTHNCKHFTPICDALGKRVRCY